MCNKPSFRTLSSATTEATRCELGIYRGLHALPSPQLREWSRSVMGAMSSRNGSGQGQEKGCWQWVKFVTRDNKPLVPPWFLLHNLTIYKEMKRKPNRLVPPWFEMGGMNPARPGRKGIRICSVVSKEPGLREKVKLGGLCWDENP